MKGNDGPADKFSGTPRIEIELKVKTKYNIVIGNPPYIQLQKLKKNGMQDVLRKLDYKTFARTGDIYCVFYEKGLNLLSSTGNIIFITNSTWLRTAFGEKMKEFFHKSATLLKVIDLSNCDLFSNAAVLTTIIQATKGKRGLSAARALHRITCDIVLTFQTLICPKLYFQI